MPYRTRLTGRLILWSMRGPAQHAGPLAISGTTIAPHLLDYPLRGGSQMDLQKIMAKARDVAKSTGTITTEQL
uniref:hypothetical protein n=1 Tax=Streptomyces turgidiscabies TaxID=85558 RepID=UPI0038F7F266